MLELAFALEDNKTLEYLSLTATKIGNLDDRGVLIGYT